MKTRNGFRCWPLAACALILPAAGCGDAPIAELAFEVRRTLPHDPAAYTQGLLIHEGAFLESTGKLGASELRLVDIATGRVLRSHALADEHFGEGIAVVGDRVIQLTWKAGLAFAYDVETFSLQQTFEYDGEGWGLCYDGASLFMSDGSSVLFRRDPATFEVLEEIRVTRDGFSERDINELECVGEHVYANVYMTNEILRIDKVTGEITGALDALSLALSSNRPPDAGAVFNGIAWDEAAGTFYVTGKYWPQMFEIAIDGG